MSSSKLKNKNLGDLAAMKNFFNGNLIEMIKPLIKQKSNEGVLKMMDIIKDKPESWFEFLSLAIFHQNFQIVKYMIENFAITPSQTPLLNALSFANDILPDNAKVKQSENKDSYQDIECPLVIQAAIGGDIEILKYLISKGFNDIDNVGHIALSKKQRNSVVSNVIGAAAFYGKTAMLEYLLKTYEKKVDINLKASEKKGKKKHMSLIKEYSGFNAVTLAIAGDANDDTTIEVMKILDGYKVNEDVDFKENNMLHIAARFDKLGVVKHIIEDLDMERLAKDTNKDGQTPYSVAESVNAKAICDYLRNNTEKDNKELEDDLKELIESGTKSKKKKKQNKGKKDDGLGLLNSSDYQETLKIEEKPIVKKKTEEIEEEESEEIEEYIDDKTKPYNNNNNYRYNNRNDYNRKNKQYGNKGRYYNNNNYDDYYGNKNYNNKGYYNRRNNYQSTTLQEVEVTDNAVSQKKYVEPVTEENKPITVEKTTITPPVEEEEEIIVGLAKKNKNKGKNKKKKEEVKVEQKEVKVEEAKIEVEPVEVKKEEPPQSPNEIKEDVQQLQPMEEAKESNNEHVHEEANNDFKNVDDEDEEESDEEDFLHEYENEPKEKHEEKLEEPIEEKKVITSSNPVVIAHDQIEYKELLDKYNELEKKFELLREEKEEMETFIRKSYQQQTTVIPSTEENINDLMELANSELEAKNKRIEELEKKLEMYTLHDIHSD